MREMGLPNSFTAACQMIICGFTVWKWNVNKPNPTKLINSITFAKRTKIEEELCKLNANA